MFSNEKVEKARKEQEAALQKKQFSDEELRNLRQQLAALKIHKRTERLCLKCGTRDHGSSPCPSRLCPVCKVMDNHSNPYDCPFLKCNLCAEKHPLAACPKRPVAYYAKCSVCGFLGHHGYECRYVQTKILERERHLNNYKFNGNLDSKTAYLEKVDELSLINHRNSHCYFYQWLRILQRQKKKKKRHRKTGKAFKPGSRKFAKYK